MGATNQTTNYELPLFIGTDKPSWLGDFNGAMNKIDTSIKGNKDEIDSLKTRMTATESVANSASSSASTALTNANNAQATANTAQSTANTANTKAEGAQSTANTALSNASTAQNTAETANSTAQSALTLGNQNQALIEDFNMTAFATIDNSNINPNIGSINTNATSISIAKNTSGSLGKIYGNVACNMNSQTGNLKVTIPTSLRPTEETTIKNCGIIRYINNNSVHSIQSANLTLKTNGNIELEATSFNDTLSITFMLFPCLYWLKDFGDTPIED